MPSFDFAPTYQDYLSANPQNMGGSEGGEGTFSGLSPDAWAALSTGDQFNNLHGGLDIAPTDPRYAALLAQTGGDPGHGIYVGNLDPQYLTDQYFTDPSKVIKNDGGVYAYNSDNMTAALQAMSNQGGLSDRDWALAPFLVGGAGVAGAFLGGAAGDLAVPAALDAVPPAGAVGALDAVPDVVGGAAAAGGAADLAVPEALGAVPGGDVGALVDAPTISGGGADLSIPTSGSATVDAGGAFGDIPPVGDFGGDISGQTLTPDLASAIPNDVTLAAPPSASVDMPTIPSGDSMTQQALDYVTQHPFRAGAAGLSVANLIAQQARAGKNPYGSQLQAAAKPITDQAAALLAQYGKGELNPGDEYGINKWTADNVARVKAYYANAGQGDSTAAMNAVAQVEAQAQAMRDKALQGLLTEGINASGLALGPLTQAIEIEAQTDSQFAAAQSNALNALLRLTMGNTTTPTTTPGGP